MPCCSDATAAVADEGHAHGIAGTEPVVELGARLIAPRLLLGRDRPDIAVRERIERIEDAGDGRRRRQSAKQHRSRRQLPGRKRLVKLCLPAVPSNCMRQQISRG